MKNKIQDIYRLPILPLNIIVIIVFNILILRNTPDQELFTMSEDEYMDEAMNKYEELYLKPFVYFLDALAAIGWIVIISLALKN